VAGALGDEDLGGISMAIDDGRRQFGASPSDFGANATRNRIDDEGDQ
jgi:hypothetical protein